MGPLELVADDPRVDRRIVMSAEMSPDEPEHDVRAIDVLELLVALAERPPDFLDRCLDRAVAARIAWEPLA